MNNIKCEVCGGSVIVNTDSGMGICDSCGNTTEIDNETVKKYKALLNAADRKMMYNSVQYYTDAIKILEDIPFVDGAKDKIDLCNKRIAEIKASQVRKAEQKKAEDSVSTKAGIAVVVCLIAGLIAIAVVLGVVIFKLAKGELTTTEISMLVAVSAVVVTVFIVSKLKNV